ncbi:Protein ZGRF1 [Microtus ochrogaster]|uniref:5'-3' DNA helicase ZGRF1 n=1 Tax=Microtus ochrogaster TaxID=79684 RepID=A0A8J6KJZ7_MICOH|nr:Protein ZGRF1 [Microtus ochrogaster]
MGDAPRGRDLAGDRGGDRPPKRNSIGALWTAAGPGGGALSNPSLADDVSRVRGRNSKVDSVSLRRSEDSLLRNVGWRGRATWHGWESLDPDSPPRERPTGRRSNAGNDFFCTFGNKVLYTHQKMKKSKVWQDGVLKTTLGNKVKPGDDLESERYLITVEEAKAAGSRVVKLDGPREALESGPRTFISSSRSLGCQPSGLKRKATGFQIPYKAPNKVTVTENGESVASFDDLKPGPTLPLPLFSTVGEEDMNYTLAVNENMFRNRERSDRPFSLVSSSFSVNSDIVRREDKFCSPVTSVTHHSDALLGSEPTRSNSLESHCPGVSQNLRSKAQILALLKSKSANMSKNLTFEIQPRGCSKTASKLEEEYAERKSSANSLCELQAENPTRATSRWTMYLPSQRSPPCSPIDENGTEDKPEAQGDVNIFNLSELLVEKKAELFETCAEKGELYHEDKPVDNSCQSWNHEENFGAPLFCENNNLLVNCSSKENVDLLLEPGIQNNNKVTSNQNDKECMEALLCTGESILVADADATLERECMSCLSVSPLPEVEHKHIEVESSPSKNSSTSDDIADVGSKSDADRGSLDTIHKSSQPFLEVSFNLSNFEDSDTDEASQEDDKLSQDSESREKEILPTDDSCVLKSCGGIGCQETARQPLPFPSSASGKPKDVLPSNETLLSEFCDRTCVGFYTGPHEDANPREAVLERGADTGSSLDSSQEWNEDVPGDSRDDAKKSIQRDGTNYGIVSPSNTPKGINTCSHIPYFLNTVTTPAPESNDLFSEGTQPQLFTLGSHVGNEQLLSPVSTSGVSIQLLKTTQHHSECRELDESNTQVSSSLFYPVGTEHPIYKDTETYIPESEDLGWIRSLPRDRFAVETTQRSKQPSATSRNSSELSEVINNMSLLKSLSEHGTTLGSLAILNENHSSQQEARHIEDPDVSPEARNLPATVVSHMLERPLEQWTFQQPVEFQGHQVKGSATSGVMVRRHSTQLGYSQLPDSVEYENLMTCTPVWTPELPSACVQTDFLQVISPEQKISASSSAPTFSFNTRNEDFVLEFSEESLRARTFPGLENIGFLGSKNLQRFPCATRASVPFITLPPDDEPAVLDSFSFMADDDTRESSSSSVLNLCEESVLSFDLGPEDQGETSRRKGTPGDASLLHKNSVQSKWLKYQNTSQCSSAALGRIGGEVAEDSEQQRNSVKESSVDPVHLQRMKGMLYQQQQDFSSRELASRKKAFSLNSKQTSETVEIQAMLGSPASYNCRVKDLQEINGSELCFPNGQKIISAYLPQRQVYVPAVFQSPIHYKQIFTSSIIGMAVIFFFSDDYLLKAFDFQRKQYGKLKTFAAVNPEFCSETKSRIYLKLSRKESSSVYNKGDLWVISKTLDFQLDTFIACSAFYGPSSVNEVELLPLKGYFPSNWPTNITVHALLVCNASTELTTLQNIQDYFNPATLPVMPYLLAMSRPATVSNKNVSKRKFIPPAVANIKTKFELLNLGATLQLASELIHIHRLNKDQATALIQIAQMMASQESGEDALEPCTPPLPITIIHGVFGAGKSYLLAVVILFFVQLFEKCNAEAFGNARPWKLLISSSTNVAVDRVLLGLLSLGFEKFVRVGSVRKIAKPILPYSLHAGSENENEQLKELHALMKEELTAIERVYVRKSIEQHKLGTNRTLLKQGHKPILLRTQYRCHPVISAIANDLFYEGNLMNGVSETERSPVLEWLPTLCFYNVTGAEQVERENSFQNVAEAAFTLKLIQSLIASGIPGSMIGVITFYKSQMYKICHLLSAVDIGHPDVKAVQVSTVDAFQGAEKEIIILSCVRTRQVGFIDSEKRMNVALTRGRRHLLIVGSLSCLRKNHLWGRVIQHCEGREDGLQHASQCEPQLDRLLKDYFEKQAEEKQKKKEKEKSKDKSH